MGNAEGCFHEKKKRLRDGLIHVIAGSSLDAASQGRHHEDAGSEEVCGSKEGAARGYGQENC